LLHPAKLMLDAVSLGSTCGAAKVKVIGQVCPDASLGTTIVMRVIHVVDGRRSERATAKSSARPPQRSLAGSTFEPLGVSTHDGTPSTTPRSARGHDGVTSNVLSRATPAFKMHALGSASPSKYCAVRWK
jgi:hypothetical protein